MDLRLLALKLLCSIGAPSSASVFIGFSSKLFNISFAVGRLYVSTSSIDMISVLSLLETLCVISGISAPLFCIPPPSSPKGTSPVTSSYSIAPNDQISLAITGIGFLEKRSGPIYAIVPAPLEAPITLLRRVVLAFAEIPKSVMQ